ncbi:LysR family transcriptional regulator [Sinorhizobium sp. 7-81]|uniref:LysR family transcriptional regulator n=1 Tax=Sinorhizobium sp. 8-89 TaxID=3049089 RepID=UPI0024C3C14F|nr:LysR family transcriptional regulator [Sinorhizobium sp. 8-89]MDK1493893.1 LysR family transcriptional regulator [Sinorhizobium sp. 8-89]
MFELIQLRCFVAIAEEMHFGRAADRMNMSQPPLSRQLQQLEHEVGFKLIERSSHFIGLTVAGKAFLKDARQILRTSEEALSNARRISEGTGGTITLGFIPATSYAVLPRLVALLLQELPHVSLNLKEMVTADQVEALAGGRIDAGILRLPIDRRGLKTIALSREKFVAAVPHSSALARRPSLHITDLDSQPFIMYSPVESRYHYHLLTTAFQPAGVQPRIMQYTREIHTMLALVDAGIGTALVPKVVGNLSFPNVCVLELEMTPVLYSELTLVWRPAGRNPALEVFVEKLLPRFVEMDANLK